MKVQIKKIEWTRRSIVAGAALPLAGCDLPPGVDFDTFKNALAISAGMQKPPKITRDAAASVPYSSIGVTVGADEQRMLILASSNGDQQLWTSADRRTLSTRNGRIISTAGFDWNLTGSEFPSGDPVSGGLQLPLPQTSLVRFVDFLDLRRFRVGISSRFEKSGSKSITILGTKLDTLALVETCQSSELGWEFVNKFWVENQSGFVWRSEQKIHPNLDPIAIEVFRPPA